MLSIDYFFYLASQSIHINTFAITILVTSFFYKFNSLSFVRSAFIPNSVSFFDKEFKKNVIVKKSLLIALIQTHTFLFVYPLLTSSSLSINKQSYKHHISNMEIELLTIFPKSIVTIYRKRFVKTADLTYFTQLKKYSKV